MQIPTPDETNDNIVAFWTPENQPKVSQPFNQEYTYLWQKDAEKWPPLSWVTQTRLGLSYQKKSDENSISLIVDFEGPSIQESVGADSAGRRGQCRR